MKSKNIVVELHYQGYSVSQIADELKRDYDYVKQDILDYWKGDKNNKGFEL